MAAEFCLIQVFAKTAVAGRVKTRLVPSLGEQVATELHVRLVEHTLATVAGADVGAVEVWTTAAEPGACVDAALRSHPVRLQPDGNLGKRLYAAARDGLQRAEAVVIVGTDCPAMTDADLGAACRALERGSDAVLGPAEDGGYWLIGLRRLDAALFDDIPWSTDRVLCAQRDRLLALGWCWEELRTLWDIDRPEDVERLRSDPVLSPLAAGLPPAVAAG